MQALLKCVAGGQAHCGAVRTWKRAQAKARWPQPAGSLSYERLYREQPKGGVQGCEVWGEKHGTRRIYLTGCQYSKQVNSARRVVGASPTLCELNDRIAGENPRTPNLKATERAPDW